MRILIIEDDVPLLHAISAIFLDESYQVDQATTGDEGLLMAESGIYDLLVLDIMLPLLDGFSIIKQLRTKGISTPILILTAKDSIEDRVKGLDYGADDYLIKPFATDELLARSRALLRRAGKIGFVGEVAYGPITISPNEHEALVQGKALKLTSKEFDLLLYLVQNKEQILTREQIFERIWGIHSETGESIVDLYIHYLRKKLSEAGYGNLIRTIRGVGYMLKGDSRHVQENPVSPGHI